MSTYQDDVDWVYRHIGETPTLEEAGSRQRLELLEWASNPTNRKEFFKTILPAAEKILAERRASEKRSIVVEEETKSIAELQGILSKALASAAAGEDPNSFEALLG